MGSEPVRKLVHVGMGGFAFLLRWLSPLEAGLCALGALLFNITLLHRLTRGSLLRGQERARGFSWAIVLYPAVVLALIVVFHSRLELAAASWGLLAFGDGMATLGGLLIGGPRLPWNHEKTWAGFTAFVLYGTAAAAALVRWTQQAVLDAAPGGAGPPHWIGGSFLDDGLAGALLRPPVLLVLCCLGAALAAAVAESLRTGIDDNLLVPLVGGAVLYGASLVEPARLIAAGGDLQFNLFVGASVNAALALAAYRVKAVALSGAWTGWVLGTCLYVFSGWRGFLMLLLFFVLGTLATRLGFRRKAALGIAQSRGGRRAARHALANVTTGVLFAFMALATPYRDTCLLGMVAAFATAACDTVATEIGQAFGRRHYLVTTLRRVEPGTAGAVSLEGTLGGLGAALALAGAAAMVGLVSISGAALVVSAAFIGSTLESYLGATVGRRNLLSGDLRNFVNTMTGAAVACLLYVYYS